MKRHIKNSFNSRNSISNNNNIHDILYLKFLTNTTPYNKNFCSSRYDIHCMMDSFLDNFMFSPNMWDWYNNVIFNTCVRNNKYSIIVLAWTFEDILEFIIMSSSYFSILSGTVHTGVEVHRMDSEMSRLVEWPWLQLICYAICLPRSHNFRW